MANQGFRGDVVLITRVAVNAGTGVPVLECSVQFASDNGTIHAVATHQFPLDPELDPDGLAAATNELLARVRRRVEAQHFREPHETERSLLQGIVETLQKPSGPRDEPGEQG